MSSSVKICCISPSDSEGNRDGADAESPFPFFFFSASFKNSSPREKVENLSSFWDCGPNVSNIVAKYNIFPVPTMAAHVKKFLQSDLLAPSACAFGILSTHILNLIVWLC